MMWQTIVSIVGFLVGLVALVSYYDGKMKDAEKMGALKNRVEQLEKQQLKNEATVEDINAVMVAIGKITEKIENIQRDVDELKKDIKCIERRKTE